MSMILRACCKHMSYLKGSGGVDDPTGEDELCDLQKDRGEMINRATDPAHREVLLQHRAILGRHIRDTRDPFYAYLVVTNERWHSHALDYGQHRGPPPPMAFTSRR